MRILLGGLLGERESIEVPAGTWISPRRAASEPAPEPMSDAPETSGTESWVERLRAGLQRPLGLPPLTDAAFPGDRIVVTLDPQTPQAEGIALEVLRELRGAGVEAENVTFLLAPGASPELAQHLRDAGRAVAGEPILVERHDPGDRKALGYLAADAEGNPIYFRRELLDADVIVPIGVSRPASPAPDESANGGLFPTFSDSDSIARFADLRRQGDLEEVREEARQANWLLGTQFAVSVAPASGEDPGQIVAGEMNAVLKASDAAVAAAWSLEMPDPAGLAVACLSGSEEQQTWDNFGRALIAADACTTTNGAVIVLTNIERPPFERAESTEQEDDRAERDEEQDEDEIDPYAAERQAREASRAVPYWRQALDEILERRTVYLAARLPDEAIEDLGMVPLTEASELQTLVTRFGDCIWIRDGQYVAWSSQLPEAETPRPKRKRKS